MYLVRSIDPVARMTRSMHVSPRAAAYTSLLMPFHSKRVTFESRCMLSKFITDSPAAWLFGPPSRLMMAVDLNTAFFH